ncbi:LytR/AlgR family response regulator transcription factor [Caenimonas aquaedulcis]|uniref:Response regulator transcription factor n=1 Tax=Caenimonas aquaedulcis TaxID=2793270 RepID=A0A931H0Z5_9BURK|nr:LytTR family DNA-binding domain-containing protein [Caenimonas aquaedulcis]MBG9386562.1 response regulator transcription factor [Caenimonas aquaedulcis]
MATALIADDEPLLRERLAALLGNLWPELEIVAQARNGREAVELFEDAQPEVAFLDVHMPGMNGIEVARCIGRRAQLVFVTAFDKYAVQAFEQGAIDYVVKPIGEQRLAETVQRLRERVASPGRDTPQWEATLEKMAAQLRERMAPKPGLKWIKASVGATVKLIPVEQVIYLKSDNKYTLVVWDGGEALIRKTIRELADELDASRFTQVHRSAIVCMDRVSHFTHGPGDSGELHLKGRSERLTVSRSYLHLFQQM